jgi:hypothetical protein
VRLLLLSAVASLRLLDSSCKAEIPADAERAMINVDLIAQAIQDTPGILTVTEFLFEDKKGL